MRQGGEDQAWRTDVEHDARNELGRIGVSETDPDITDTGAEQHGRHHGEQLGEHGNPLVSQLCNGPHATARPPFRANLSLHVITGGCTRNPHACHSPAPGVARCPALPCGCRLGRRAPPGTAGGHADLEQRRTAQASAGPRPGHPGRRRLPPEHALPRRATGGLVERRASRRPFAGRGQRWLRRRVAGRPAARRTGLASLAGDRGSAAPLAAVGRRQAVRRAVLSGLEQTRGKTHRSGAMALPGRPHPLPVPSGRTLPGSAAGRRRQRGSARRLRRVPEELPGLPPSQRCRRRPVRPGPEPAVQPHRVLPAAIPRPLHPRPAGAAAMATGENAGVPGTGDRRPGVAPADRLPAPHGRYRKAGAVG